MMQSHHDGTHTDISTTPGRSILPLPEQVVAQIKSSTAIVSLHGVLLELFKNALDAKSTRIDATIDFARGACVVEDDGLGIAPLEFRAEGGLGKLYCTSKHDACEALLGRNGAFLASLSAVSLLNITSRHHQHRSHNSVTFHHATAIERQLPAPAQHEIHGKHGTRVTVRNLFGNLPVRVKQRSKVLEHKAEHDRLWESLKANVAGLLLSWAGSVSLRARDADNRIIFNFNTSESKQVAEREGADASKPRSAHLALMLNVLTQANYIAIDDWSSWVPASASTSALSVKGAISLEPAPTKHIQFISLGVQPLLAELENNELYDHVNRLFGLSSFGASEEYAEVDELEKLRRRSDKRFKREGHTNQQLKARKGVDRHPMFHLRILFHEQLDSSVSRACFLKDETNVQAIVDVLGAMITQWLSVHHFRPIQPRCKRNMSRDDHGSSEIEDPSSRNDTVQSAPSTLSPSTAGANTSNSASASKVQHRTFAEWSRIKSAKSDFFTNASGITKDVRKSTSPLARNDEADHNCHTLPLHPRPVASANFILQPVAQGALNVQTPPQFEHAQESEKGTEMGTENTGNGQDGTILWMDPLTKKTCLLNARTGCVMPNVRNKPDNTPLLRLSSKTSNGASKSVRLPPKTATLASTPWLDGVMKTWDNPVFEASEKRIEQVSVQEHALDHRAHQSRQPRWSRSVVESAFNALPSFGLTRLSKDNLSCAEVIAQVDSKFILAKIPSLPDPSLAHPASTKTLILIDQHAADERIQVEALFEGLCAPVSTDSACSRYRSGLGHRVLVSSVLLDKPLQFVISQQERTYFTTYAERFANWGILFDILDTPVASAKERHILSVTTLSPTISERCKSDPSLLISLLRSTVWNYASNPHSMSDTSFSPNAESPSWVRSLATCPEGLVNMVNSRACRSAIMFNDDLNLGQCRELVQKLAMCVFPFMCAHGRPSMVPLVDVERIGDGTEASELEPSTTPGGFVQAWKQWKQ